MKDKIIHGLFALSAIQTPFYDRVNCEKWLLEIPKVVLHHHLDGSVRPETTLDLARKGGIDLGVPLELEAVRDAVTVRTPQADLASVLKRFWVFQKVFTSYDNVKRITIENLEDLYNDGVRLAELRFAPAFMGNGIAIGAPEIIQGVADGLIEGQKLFPDLQVGLVHIVVRSHAGANVEEMRRMNELSTREAVKFRASSHPMANRMVGLDLAGSENDTPASDYVHLVKLALDGGMKITVHSGEESGPERVREAIDLLHASRIGHGVQIWGDEATMRLVREKNVHLEVAPTSNWITNHIPKFDLFGLGRKSDQFDLVHHPLKDLWKAGISVSIEGDDPQLFGISTVHEYQLLHYVLGLSREDFMAINRRAAKHSFLPNEIKRAVLERYYSHP